MKKTILSGILICLSPAFCWAAPQVSIRLPERFRLLAQQQFDFRVEATGLASLDATVTVQVNGKPVGTYVPEVTTDNDSNPADLDKAWTYRNVSFPTPGVKEITVTVSDNGAQGQATHRVGVQDFDLNGGKRKSIVLFIGDAMGTTYRDAGRIVAKSTENRFREGFFDQLQNMDTMPVSGMVMTYAEDRLVPDSANTATAWASGNKTIDGALNVQPDNDDFKYDSTNIQNTKQFALDNPRMETLWEYLKRVYGYKTGIVTTADVTDATPGGQGGHSITRSLLYDIARQYVDGVFTTGSTFDVIMGGGKEKFDSRTVDNSGDSRNLIVELQAAGYTFVGSRTELNALGGGASKVLGLFRTSNMNVAYDKLGLVRDPDEPLPDFGGFTDQPFLDEMTDKAIAALSTGGSPFILMVEAASIDKQSHPNHADGVIWDTIEFDKSVGVGRTFAGGNAGSTLVLVTADHDQSMHIVGIGDAAVTGSVLNTRSNSVYPATIAPFTPTMGPFYPFGAPPRVVAPANFGNNVGEVIGFPDYADGNADGYPENTNEFRIAVGFRTGNHTGSSVPITAEGPGAFQFTGYFDQTDIFFKMARSLSSDTRSVDTLLSRAGEQFRIIDQNY
ncbi:MAG: alkaline phosphatase [Chthoniobacterales bacterium]